MGSAKTNPGHQSDIALYILSVVTFQSKYSNQSEDANIYGKTPPFRSDQHHGKGLKVVRANFNSILEYFLLKLPVWDSVRNC